MVTDTNIIHCVKEVKIGKRKPEYDYEVQIITIIKQDGNKIDMQVHFEP